MATESSSITEGTVTFDIRFWAGHPVSGELVRLIINIEAQNDFYPGYPLVKRGIYYGSRMISSQYGTEFTDSDYDKIKKVYSVWICMNPPAYRQNTITQYSIDERNMVGAVKEKREYYDLMSVVMVCLGNPKNSESKLLKLLSVLFSAEIGAEEKKRILSQEYGIKITRTQEKEMTQMCNYSKGVWEKGLAEGMEKGLEKGIENALHNLMESMKWTIEQALTALQIPEQQWEQYRKKMN